MDVRGATSTAQRLEATTRFGKFFAGALFDVYGGVATPLGRFDPAAPARKKRPLRVAAPEIHPFVTDDGVALRLTRHRGGTKGPVILSHGLGVSSRIFATDTIETNLLKFLYAHGYDVWLLDFRASIDLPASAESTLRTVELLQQRNGSQLYRRHVIPSYGHIDCIFGKQASREVFPLILEHLEATK